MGMRVESDCQALPAVWLPQVTLPPHLRNGEAAVPLSQSRGERQCPRHAAHTPYLMSLSPPSSLLLISSHQQESCEREPGLVTVLPPKFKWAQGRSTQHSRFCDVCGSLAPIPPAHSHTGGGRSHYHHTHNFLHLTCSSQVSKEAHALPSPEAQCCSPWPMHQSKSLTSEDLLDSFYPRRHRASLAGLTESPLTLNILVFM